MLQYTVHPPPLQVSFSKSTLKFRNNDHYPHRRTTNNNNSTSNSNNSNVNNSSSFRPSTAPAVPSSPSSPYHSPSTFFPAPPPPLPSRFILPADDDELPSPSFPPASLPKAISRLPSAAAQPPTTANDSYFPPSSSSPAIAPVAISSFGSSSSVSDNDDIPDVLVPGDVVGHGLPLRNETLRPAKLPVAAPLPSPHAPPADAEFEVVRKLGTGSYAVVYLVREVLSHPTPPSSDSGLDMDFDDDSAQGQRQQRRDEVEYGREYAVKLLSKANLDADALAAQLFEATVHQSLPAHPNLVSLHRSYETRSYLLLLLEFVPGEDLFYFLEQARDHYVPPSPSPPPSPSTADARTPPTPGLLSSLHPSQLLSPVRLRLVARMFAQMCEAVAVCHDAGVFHRDIKPENFIVTDGLGPVDERGVRERRVVVKLSDFGLATTDEESADMDCGSAPYMAYECRNNLAPTYRPRAADVWSLGIVLINMLYHCNPWTDTADGACTSFAAYRANPTSFLSARFPGLTPAVTAFLSQRVFCILPDPGSCEPRVSARELGIWVRDLPLMLAGGSAAIARTISGGPGRGHVRGASASSLAGVVGVGHALGSVPPSRRPSSRIMSRVPSTVAIAAVSATTAVGGSTAGTAICEEICEEPREVIQEQEDAEQEQDQDQDQDPTNGRDSRTSTSTKRRKRGARKNKSAAASSTPVPVPSLNATSTTMDTSEMLASASQTLARELSRASRGTGPSLRSVPSNPSIHTHVHSHAHAHASYGPSFVGAGMPAVSALPVPAKKPSIWKLGFGKSGDGQRQDKDKDNKDKDSKDKERETPGRAANVSDLILGLSADPSTHSAHSPHGSNQTASAGSGSARSGASGRSEDRAWARGRQPRDAPSSSPVHHHPHSHPHPHPPLVPISPVHHHPHPHPPPVPISVSISPPSSASVAPAATAFGSPFGSGARSAFGGGVGGASRSSLAVNVVEGSSIASGKLPQRSPAGPPARSPARSSNRSPPRSGAWSPNGAGSSNASVNSSSTSPRSAGAGSASWRNSMASTSTASSAFTRYSNQSARSVATSVSSAASEGNWRAKSTVSVASGATGATGAKEKGKGRSSGGKAPQYPYPYSGGVPPPNVKYMTGVPWELSELPRQLHPKPEGDIFGQPPAPRPRRSKPKALSAAGVVDNNLGTISESGRVDAGTSTTDLSMVTGGEEASGNGEDGGQKKVVQKGQINALAKMLGALRR